MNNYLAKSNPQETIIEHTDKLLENFEILKQIYPDLEIDWDILYLCCLYHDLGKMNIKFQDKLEKRKRHKDEIPHAVLSLAFLDTKKLKENYSKEQIKILAHSIAYHHDREFNFTKEELKEEIEAMKEEFENFEYDKLKKSELKKISAKYFNMKNINEEEMDLFIEYIKIKGLLNRIDYAASSGIEVEKTNDFLINNLNKNLLEKFRNYDKTADWNDLQKYMIDNRDKNIIITAQTGMGKTEAGLLWIGDTKGFFTLPLKTAINAMYKRIIENIVLENYENKVGLLHSDIKREYINVTEVNEIDFDEYYDKTKQLSLPLTICTIDQLFGFVYRYRGFESKLATLSYSKIVIDEVQMYSADLLAYLVIGIWYINKIGGKFAILTATLPSFFVDLLENEGIEFEQATFTNNKIRHSLKNIEDSINSKFIKEKYKENKVLVICNTVKEAQNLYMELSSDENIKPYINLFHSGFIKKDRSVKEMEILEFGATEDINKISRNKGIWITTQVVEASLDIDFDILITELSDLNGLFQRMGRCYRSRDWTYQGYNCFVFNGGEKTTNGIGNIIDKEIFNLSKESLREIDGEISELEKINLINKIYSTEMLKDTEYYKNILDAIHYIKLIETNEKSKREVDKLFRNIESKDIIPQIVYENNKEIIQTNINILQKKYEKNMNNYDRKKLKKEKILAKLAIDDFKVPVRLNLIHREKLETIKITDYNYLEILECYYDKNIGIKHDKDKAVKDKDKQEEDKFF